MAVMLVMAMNTSPEGEGKVFVHVFSYKYNTGGGKEG